MTKQNNIMILIPSFVGRVRTLLTKLMRALREKQDCVIQ